MILLQEYVQKYHLRIRYETVCCSFEQRQYHCGQRRMRKRERVGEREVKEILSVILLWLFSFIMHADPRRNRHYRVFLHFATDRIIFVPQIPVRKQFQKKV